MQTRAIEGYENTAENSIIELRAILLHMCRAKAESLGESFTVTAAFDHLRLP